jgi:hypothetical protein
MAIADFDYDRFNDRSVTDRLRGCVLTFRGSLRRFEPVRSKEFLEVIGRAGLETCFEGQVQDAEGGWYSFYCLQPLGQPWESGDVVQLTGVFLKLIKFPTRAGTEKGTPLLVARELVFVRTPVPRSVTERAAGPLPPWIAPVVLAGAFIVVALVVLVLTRKKAPPIRISTEGLEDLTFEPAPPESAEGAEAPAEPEEGGDESGGAGPPS